MKEDLKTVLFIEVVTALEAYQAATAARFPSPEAKRRQERFSAVWAVRFRLAAPRRDSFVFVSTGCLK